MAARVRAVGEPSETLVQVSLASSLPDVSRARATWCIDWKATSSGSSCSSATPRRNATVVEKRGHESASIRRNTSLRALSKARRTAASASISRAHSPAPSSMSPLLSGILVATASFAIAFSMARRALSPMLTCIGASFMINVVMSHRRRSCTDTSVLAASNTTRSVLLIVQNSSDSAENSSSRCSANSLRVIGMASTTERSSASAGSWPVAIASSMRDLALRTAHRRITRSSRHSLPGTLEAPSTGDGPAFLGVQEPTGVAAGDIRLGECDDVSAPPSWSLCSEPDPSSLPSSPMTTLLNAALALPARWKRFECVSTAGAMTEMPTIPQAQTDESWTAWTTRFEKSRSGPPTMRAHTTRKNSESRPAVFSSVVCMKKSARRLRRRTTAT
mmetsp:Transcript_17239/g.60586  ORF Transcript_17239/g.60586 Transcript_17239/m.60586 type:complete len:389 (+) Transcript_17239:214-1380(+)